MYKLRYWLLKSNIYLAWIYLQKPSHIKIEINRTSRFRLFPKTDTLKHYSSELAWNLLSRVSENKPYQFSYFTIHHWHICRKMKNIWSSHSWSPAEFIFICSPNWSKIPQTSMLVLDDPHITLTTVPEFWVQIIQTLHLLKDVDFKWWLHTLSPSLFENKRDLS